VTRETLVSPESKNMDRLPMTSSDSYVSGSKSEYDKLH